jgi:hypothetical protein
MWRRPKRTLVESERLLESWTLLQHCMEPVLHWLGLSPVGAAATETNATAERARMMSLENILYGED